MDLARFRLVCCVRRLPTIVALCLCLMLSACDSDSGPVAVAQKTEDLPNWQDVTRMTEDYAFDAAAVEALQPGGVSDLPADARAMLDSDESTDVATAFFENLAAHGAAQREHTAVVEMMGRVVFSEGEVKDIELFETVILVGQSSPDAERVDDLVAMTPNERGEYFGSGLLASDESESDLVYEFLLYDEGGSQYNANVVIPGIPAETRIVSADFEVTFKTRKDDVVADVATTFIDIQVKNLQKKSASDS